MTASDVATLVVEYPGIHFNEIVARLEITPDKLQRITGDLEETQQITIVDLYGKTHFYPPDFDSWEQKALALIRRETSREILYYLLECDPATPNEVANEVGIARSTLEWHLDRLVDAELVSKHQDNWHVELTVAKPEAVNSLLQEIQPTLPERWIDRTSRLLDHLLEKNSHS